VAGKKKKDLPVFVKEESGSVDDDMKELGVELSKTLPTYDVPIELVTKNDFNPNEMDDDTFNRLVKEIEETGMVSAIQVVPSPGGKFTIIGGEHRWQALQTLGWQKIPCNILTDERFMDVDLQELLTVRLNVIHGKLNPDKFIKLYEKKVEKYGEDQLQALFGFTSSDAWKKITQGVEKAVKESGIGGDGLLAALKDKTKKVKSVDGLGKILNNLFRQYGSDLKHSFMIFTYGGKQHLYVMLSPLALQGLEVLMAKCRDESRDMNDLIVPMLERLAGEDKSKGDVEG